MTNNNLENSIEALKTKSNELVFSERFIIMVSLVARCIDLASCILILSKGNKTAGVPILVRSVLEVYCHIKSIQKRKANFYYLELQSLRQSKKEIINIENNPKNPFLPSFENNEELLKYKNDISGRLTELKKSGYSDGSGMKGLFDRAGLAAINQSIYPLLCRHSHSNISVLRSLHLLTDENEDGKYKVVYGNVMKEDQMNAFLDLMTDIMNDLAMVLSQASDES